MKKLFGMLGVGLIISGVTAAVYLMKKKKSKTSQTERECEDVNGEDQPATPAVMEELVYEDIKSGVAKRISSTYANASEFIRGSVENIRENLSISKNTNSELDKLSAELDKKLREEK